MSKPPKRRSRWTGKTPAEISKEMSKVATARMQKYSKKKRRAIALALVEAKRKKNENKKVPAS